MKSSPSFIKRYLAKLSWKVLVILLAITASIVAFGFVMHEVVIDKDVDFDHRVFNHLTAYITPARTRFMEIVTWCASSHFLQVSYALLVLGYLLKKNWKRSIEIGVVGLGGFAINYVMKNFFERVRPHEPLVEPLKNFSFPSGHATSAFIFYGLLVFLAWKTKLARSVKIVMTVLLILFATLIGFSRIYLRLHYTTDVIAGFCIGIAWLAISIWQMERTKELADEEMSGSE